MLSSTLILPRTTVNTMTTIARLQPISHITGNSSMLNILLVEDNPKLRPAMKSGLEATGDVHIAHDCASGEAALGYCLSEQPDAILMDVQLEGEMNGIEAAIAIRREFPRMPVVFYSIQDDDDYYR